MCSGTAEARPSAMFSKPDTSCFSSWIATFTAVPQELMVQACIGMCDKILPDA
jgi:hypothetical protein